ncbi:zonadhesin-like [Hemicordylus capensis]|uniref:zonadhesin-like n=1 Tax=Hemicordylus capensis TaxID=884348 RepID=UPI002302DB8A|nr:zonadhesin-like [Hemicordylus capensis]
METLGCFQHIMMGVCLSVASIKGTEDRDPVTGLERRLGPGIKAEGGGSARKQPEAVWRLPHPTSTYPYPSLLWSSGAAMARWRQVSSARGSQGQSARGAPAQKGPPGKATSCPPNSHYYPCTTACPASCAEPASPDTCRLPCVKGCACDSGFLLYNGSCVSRRQCGCRHEGKHYPVGSQFWTDHTCSSRCTCPTPGGQLGCSSDSCPKGSYCGVENSTIGCYNYTHKVCRVHGDPHYSTFDNENYHFMGNCTYTLAKLCSKLAELPHFNIEAKNEYLESPSRSFVHKVLMDLYGHHIEIHKGNQHQVLVDQIWRTLPVKHGKGSVSVSRSGRYISVETDFQLIINYDADHLVEIRMPTTFVNATCGLCGNFNNLKDDDNLMPNGQRAKNATELGKSWQVPGAEYDRPYCEVPDITPPCSTYQEDAYKENEFCGILTNSEGPFQVCHSTISPESFFDTCVRDMCAFNGKQTLLCNTLGAYGDACQREGVALGNWRIDTFCLFLCPSHSEHDMCTSACPTTCANPMAPKNCSKPCVEGCKCHEGYILSGQQCVLTEDCGCLDEGKYYEKGATFWKTDCRGRCHCAENGTLTCNTETCKADQICKVQNGILACYTSDKASCHIYGDPHYVTFDERLYHFQGGCNYTAVETYNHSSEEFSVTIRKERQGHQAWTALNAVAVSLKNLHIALRKNKEVSME